MYSRSDSSAGVMEGGKYALVHKSFGALPLRPVPIYEGALPRPFRSINSFDEDMPRMRCRPFLMRNPCGRCKLSQSKGLRPSLRMIPSKPPNPFLKSTPLINRNKQLLSFILNIIRSHLIYVKLSTAKMTTIINCYNTPVLGELQCYNLDSLQMKRGYRITIPPHLEA